MYADDTTIYVVAPSPDMVANVLNSVLRKLHYWCCHNSLTPHPGETEYMLLQCGLFTGPLQGIRLGDNYINHVSSPRCLGVETDSMLKWNIHVKELCKCFTKKLKLLRSLYFLPILARVDFYFKVILPSVTYGMLVWGSCGTSLFIESEKIHVHAAKFIYGLDWLTPSDEVLLLTKWKTLKQMYIRRVLCLVYKCITGVAPFQLRHLWSKQINGYNLRRKNCLVLPKHRFC